MVEKTNWLTRLTATKRSVPSWSLGQLYSACDPRIPVAPSGRRTRTPDHRHSSRTHTHREPAGQRRTTTKANLPAGDLGLLQRSSPVRFNRRASGRCTGNGRRVRANRASRKVSPVSRRAKAANVRVTGVRKAHSPLPVFDNPASVPVCCIQGGSRNDNEVPFVRRKGRREMRDHSEPPRSTDRFERC